MKVIGVDGCHAGWFAILLDARMRCVSYCYQSLTELWSQHSSVDLLLIDIPIGLPDRVTRRRLCDVEARSLLGKQSQSSVFPPPSRAVFQAADYRKACWLNKREIGKMITRQTWAITPKIREVDQCLRRHPRLRQRIRETHPELAFWALNGGEPLTTRKRFSAGCNERLAILRKHWAGVDSAFEMSRDQFERKDAALDDILDAMVAAITARNDLTSIPDKVERDAQGIKMEIVFSSIP
jgi:predicted RNase H-like nuclease